MAGKSNRPAPSRRGNRGDVTRKKLLSASVDVFGRYGFDVSSTAEMV